MKKLTLFLAALLILLSCASAVYEPIPLRKVPYSLDSDIFRVTMKDQGSHILKKVRVMPDQNLVKGIDVKSGENKSLNLNRVDKIEKRVSN